MLLGNKIREFRKERGMTQEKLADLLHVTSSAISSYETEKRTPDIYMLCNIADLFDVNLDNLLGRTKE